MNYEEFNTEIKKQIEFLSYERRLEFAILIAKRLYFDYQKFSEVYNWGDPDLLMDGINICQQSLSYFIDNNQINELLLKIDLIRPDMDDFGDELGSYALNASTAVYESLQFLIDKDQVHIYNITTYYTDTIYFRIQENQQLTFDEIERHSLTVEARNFLIDASNNGV